MSGKSERNYMLPDTGIPVVRQVPPVPIGMGAAIYSAPFWLQCTYIVRTAERLVFGFD